MGPEGKIFCLHSSYFLCLTADGLRSLANQQREVQTISSLSFFRPQCQTSRSSLLKNQGTFTLFVQMLGPCLDSKIQIPNFFSGTCMET